MLMHTMKDQLDKIMTAVIMLYFLTIPVYAASKDAVMVGDVITQNSKDKAYIRFGIITLNGYVSFETSGDWLVLSIQSQPPVSAAVFQIPNPADQNTPDSTNLGVTLIQTGTEEATKALATIGKKYEEGDVAPKTISRDGWDIFSQKAYQNKTKYTILDAKKKVADVIVWVRLAYPHLKDNKKHYDDEMESTLNKILNSFEGQIGPYKTKEDDVIRRRKKESWE